VTNPSILYSEPSNHTAQPVEGPGFTAYVIPNTEPSKLSEADAVIVFAHGGGMMIGHPLQYLKSYRRWAGKARKMGKNVAFLALKYRETHSEDDDSGMLTIGSFVNCPKVARSAEHTSLSV
jgi:hypothetical protein